jgi:hypothetical protein
MTNSSDATSRIQLRSAKRRRLRSLRFHFVFLWLVVGLTSVEFGASRQGPENEDTRLSQVCNTPRMCAVTHRAAKGAATHGCTHPWCLGGTSVDPRDTHRKIGKAVLQAYHRLIRPRPGARAHRQRQESSASKQGCDTPAACHQMLGAVGQCIALTTASALAAVRVAAASACIG